MPAHRMISAAAVSLCILFTSGCAAGISPSSGSAPPVPTSTSTAAPRSSVPAPTASATPRATPPATGESLTETFDYGNFGDPIAIVNRWLPLVPGTQRVLEGSATVDGKRIKRKVVITTTDLTKVIDGIRTVVNYELDYDSGELVEAELAFFVQDDDGTIWHLGQYPEEYEDGKFVDSKVWLAGYEGAKAGITMHARPALATPSYSEGWGPKVGWTDRGRVFDMGSKTCVPAGCYADVLVIDEFNRDEPDAHQLKYYASGVGNVRVGWAGALEEEQETLELVKVVHLTPEALATIRSAALALEKHGYVTSKDLYGLTEPARQR